jgi:hypothetical protein
MAWEDAKIDLGPPENNEVRERNRLRVFIFATSEGGRMEVWQDPKGEFYQAARTGGSVAEAGRYGFSRKVNWIASAVIDDDYDFTLQAPRETA